MAVAPINKDQPKKQGILKYLDNTFGEDGLRTDIKITVTNETALKIVGIVAVSAFTFYIIRSMFIPKIVQP